MQISIEERGHLGKREMMSEKSGVDCAVLGVHPGEIIRRQGSSQSLT